MEPTTFDHQQQGTTYYTVFFKLGHLVGQDQSWSWMRYLRVGSGIEIIAMTD